MLLTRRGKPDGMKDVTSLLQFQLPNLNYLNCMRFQYFFVLVVQELISTKSDGDIILCASWVSLVHAATTFGGFGRPVVDLNVVTKPLANGTRA